jgi:O-antigen/teichoic acid export membrane protein
VSSDPSPSNQPPGTIEGRPLARLLARNTGFNIGASLVALGAGLVVSPILLFALGPERFGLWALLWAITGSLGLFDLRLAAAITPLAATAWTRRDSARLSSLARTAIGFYSILGLAEIGIAYALIQVPGLVAWIPAGIRDEAVSGFVLAMGAFALRTLSTVLIGLLNALHRYDIRSIITITLSVLRAISLITIAWAGGGIRELLFAELLLSVCQVIASGIAVRLILPDLTWLRLPDLKTLRELASFGGKLQIAHAAHLVSFHADKLLLSFFLGLSAVANYEMGSKAASISRTLPLLLISATLPVASNLDARGERERLWRLYERGTSLLITAATPLLILACVGANDILFAWAGIEALEAQQTLGLLAIGYYLNLVTGMVNTISIGIGKPELEMRRSLMVGLLNLTLSATLIYFLGFVGAPLGTVIALAVGSWYLIRAFHSILDRPVSAFLKLFRFPLLAALPLSLITWFILRLSDGSRVGTILGLAIAALLLGVSYAALAIAQGTVKLEWIRAPGGDGGSGLETDLE